MPLFRLPELRGGVAGPLDVNQRRPALVALAHPGGCQECASFLDLLGDEARGERLEGAAPFVLFLDDPRGRPAEAPYAQLVDDGRIARQVASAAGRSPGEAISIVADRFGEISGVKPIHGLSPEEVLEDGLDTIRWIEMQCPE